ncbi:MAG: leucyl/phenylalanyl-tRNA--protein transferase [bacterium]|nr:leucyl/phenylalanyl-tRNA--protein transferase [bacterium]
MDTAGPEGLLAIGGDLDQESLKLAYHQGIFPWPTEEFPLLWFAPPQRAIIEFSDIKVPRRFQRERKRLNFHFEVDRNFKEVIRACAQGSTRRSRGTWITPEMVEAYTQFHQSGFAHSFECYNPEGQLVGGLYGVSLGQMFAGESMFFLESGASKEVLLFTCQFLKDRGAHWMDVQMMSPLLKSFGAKEITREDFMEKLNKALKAPPLFSQ